MSKHRVGWYASALAAGMVTLLATTALPAAGAFRLGAYVTRTKDVALGTNQVASTKVKCPDGYRVTAAGTAWIKGGPDPVVRGRRIAASGPINGGRTWYVAASNGDGVHVPAPVTLRITLRCLPLAQVGALTAVRADVSGNAGFFVDGYAQCPAGSTIVSGGAMWMAYAGDGSGRLVLTINEGRISTSSPVDRATWIAGGKGPGMVLRVVTLCQSAKVVGGTVEPPPFQDVSVSGYGYGSVSVRCPSGTRVLVGGSFWKTKTDGLVFDRPLGNSRPDADSRGWSAKAFNYGGDERKLAVMAICRRT